MYHISRLRHFIFYSIKYYIKTSVTIEPQILLPLLDNPAKRLHLADNYHEKNVYNLSNVFLTTHTHVWRFTSAFVVIGHLTAIQAFSIASFDLFQFRFLSKEVLKHALKLDPLRKAKFQGIWVRSHGLYGFIIEENAERHYQN